MDYSSVAQFIREQYHSSDFIPLHEPVFLGNEKRYLQECIDSTFVSSVGKFVDRFEEMVAEFTGARYAVAVVNGTAALHTALICAGVRPNDEVITQPLTFIATCNAISYCQAVPLFVDVDRRTLGMSAAALERFLLTETEKTSGGLRNRVTGNRIGAILPMHTFGNPCEIERIQELARSFEVPMIEDAAESLGSYYGEKHTGRFGLIGTFSFNGNKTITTGGGGMVITDDPGLASRAKHLTTTAKLPHEYEFLHDEIGFNYRLPNINAALGCAQMESLPLILRRKKKLASKYREFFAQKDVEFVEAVSPGKSNHWLNALVLQNPEERQAFLEFMNSSGVMVRPVWRLMSRLPMFESAPRGNLYVAESLEQRVVNIPSGPRMMEKEEKS
ncbi:MAG: LegC family aminotransferase [Leptospiraceae bacterium]